MFGRKQQEIKKELDLKNENYNMKEVYDSANLVAGCLEYVSSRANDACTPHIVKVQQRYLFEKIIKNGEEKYREIFTGYIADTISVYFDLPYIIDIKPVMDEVECAQRIPKYGMLLLFNDINDPKKRKIEKVNSYNR